MISALVSSYWVDKDKSDCLGLCLDSLVGADEILSLVTHRKAPLGFSDAWNRLSTIAKGNYLIFIGDNNVQISGHLKDLCVPGTVTSPLINGKGQEFWGMVFCMPRDIYEKVGLYDMRFNNGSHWEDQDLWDRLKLANIPRMSIPTVNFYRNQGGRTIDVSPDNEIKKRMNAEIFKEKWNGKTISINPIQ